MTNTSPLSQILESFPMWTVSAVPSTAWEEEVIFLHIKLVLTNYHIEGTRCIRLICCLRSTVRLCWLVLKQQISFVAEKNGIRIFQKCLWFIKKRFKIAGYVFEFCAAVHIAFCCWYIVQIVCCTIWKAQKPVHCCKDMSIQCMRGWTHFWNI